MDGWMAEETAAAKVEGEEGMKPSDMSAVVVPCSVLTKFPAGGGGECTVSNCSASSVVTSPSSWKTMLSSTGSEELSWPTTTRDPVEGGLDRYYAKAQ